MNDVDNRKIFNIRAQIQSSKAKGYKVNAVTVAGKEVVTIVCKELKVNFFIGYEELLELHSMWLRSGLTKFIQFHDWLLKTDLQE